MPCWDCPRATETRLVIIFITFLWKNGELGGFSSEGIFKLSCSVWMQPPHQKLFITFGMLKAENIFGFPLQLKWIICLSKQLLIKLIMQILRAELTQAGSNWLVQYAGMLNIWGLMGSRMHVGAKWITSFYQASLWLTHLSGLMREFRWRKIIEHL